VAAGIVSIFLPRRVVGARHLATALCALAVALAVLVTLLIRAHEIETTSRQRLYADPIVAYRHSAYQEIVVTRRGNDTRLYLDGGLQFSTRDEYRYTESLVHPRSATAPARCWCSAATTAWRPESCCARTAFSRSCRRSSTPP
jgi:spermidine synthase